MDLCHLIVSVGFSEDVPVKTVGLKVKIGRSKNRVKQLKFKKNVYMISSSWPTKCNWNRIGNPSLNHHIFHLKVAPEFGVL